MGEQTDSFPLFPLGLVMLPSELVPLHIFEDRYRLMVRECMAEEREFGIVWASDDGLAAIGCSGRIAQLLEELEDGRLNILVQGTRPFRLLSRTPDRPYPAGEVVFLDDADEAAAPDDLLTGTRELYASLVERVTDRRPDEDELAALDAYGMAATIEFDVRPKQILLEERSETARLGLVRKMLDDTLRKLDISEQANERAKSNGKLR